MQGGVFRDRIHTGTGGVPMEGSRANPDQLLRAIQKQDEAATQGHLTIFFGYAAGVWERPI